MEAISPRQNQSISTEGAAYSGLKRFLVLVLLFPCFLGTGCDRSRGLAPFEQRGAGHTRKSRAQKSIPGQIIVKKKDTIYALSRRYNVPTRAIIEANRLSAPFLLRPGQRLKIPQAEVHVVRAGETLYSIARQHGVDMRSLIALNHLTAPYVLHKGDQLTLPGRVVKARSWSSKGTAKGKSKPKTKINAAASAQKKSLRQKLHRMQPTKRSSSKFMRPVAGSVIAKYGWQKGGLQNDGINIVAKKGAPVQSAENGIVVYAGQSIESFGNLVLVKHADGWVSAYGHLDKIQLKHGMKVKRGQVVGTVGQTGHVKSPQLHFELRRKTKAVDPSKYI